MIITTIKEDTAKEVIMAINQQQQRRPTADTLHTRQLSQLNNQQHLLVIQDMAVRKQQQVDHLTMAKEVTRAAIRAVKLQVHRRQQATAIIMVERVKIQQECLANKENQQQFLAKEVIQDTACILPRDQALTTEEEEEVGSLANLRQLPGTERTQATADMVCTQQRH